MFSAKFKAKAKKNILLYIGLLFLYIALLTRIFVSKQVSLFFLAIAICFKLAFAFQRIKKTTYKVGYELVLFIVGLSLFLTGVYAPLPDFICSPFLLIIPGLAMKISSVVILIRKLKKA